jgi:hypothetical protein
MMKGPGEAWGAVARDRGEAVFARARCWTSTLTTEIDRVSDEPENLELKVSDCAS